MFLAQSIQVDPETITALNDLNIVTLALVVLLVVLGLSFWALNTALRQIGKNTDALGKITDRLAVTQEKDVEQREKTRHVFDKTVEQIGQVSTVLAKLNEDSRKQYEETTDVLKGKDGVLEILRISAAKITDLTTATQGVADIANNIINSIEMAKQKMAESIGDVGKRQLDELEAMQKQLKTLTAAVEAIPGAVATTEANVISTIKSILSDGGTTDEKVITRPVTVDPAALTGDAGNGAGQPTLSGG